MRGLLIGIQRFWNVRTKLNRINGTRNLYIGMNHNAAHGNNMMPFMMMDFYKAGSKENFVPQGFFMYLQLVKNNIINTTSSSNDISNDKFNKVIKNIDVINQNDIYNPSTQCRETIQLDSVLRKRRKKMKKHKLRKRRKREKALKRKISQGQKK